MNDNSNPVAFFSDGIATFPLRLKELIGDESLRSFGQMVGVSEGGLRKYLPPGTSKPTFDKVVAIARYKHVNLEWLATGEGPKYPGAHQELTIGTHQGEINEEDPRYSREFSSLTSAAFYRDEFDEEYALIEGYHVTVSTGHGAFNGDYTPVKRHLAFRRKWLNYRGFKPEQLKVVFAKGDSMEPTINSGDSLLINLAASKPIDGEIFVVRLGEDLYAKRIQKRWDGSIELISDNKEYKEQVIPAHELDRLAIIGQVVWLGKDLGK